MFSFPTTVCHGFVNFGTHGWLRLVTVCYGWLRFVKVFVTVGYGLLRFLLRLVTVCYGCLRFVTLAKVCNKS